MCSYQELSTVTDAGFASVRLRSGYRDGACARSAMRLMGCAVEGLTTGEPESWQWIYLEDGDGRPGIGRLDATDDPPVASPAAYAVSNSLEAFERIARLVMDARAGAADRTEEKPR